MIINTAFLIIDYMIVMYIAVFSCQKGQIRPALSILICSVKISHIKHREVYAINDFKPHSNGLSVKWATSWENLSSGFPTKSDSNHPAQL